MKPSNKKLDNLYDFISGDEDARVCKDIPEKACYEQPRNFFAYLIANCFGKIADEIASAKLIFPWLFGMLGVPASFTGFLVPVRESGVLLPQLFVAAIIRQLAVRKFVWITGAILSAFSLLGMAYAALNFEGTLAGIVLTSMLIVFSISRGLCSVAAKDVLGKTISKSRRGRLMGWSASLSGAVILVFGVALTQLNLEQQAVEVFVFLFIGAAVLWLLACIAFFAIEEQPGSTEGGGNAISAALANMRLIYTDIPFRRFVIARALLLSAAFAPPFFVIVAQANSTGLMGLGILIIANGLASTVSSPFWGYLGDSSSKSVMMYAMIGASTVCTITGLAALFEVTWLLNEFGMAFLFFLLTVMHNGARLGRKIYLVDMANNDNRAAYVAVSNTLIGLLMLAGGLVGVLGELFGAAIVILTLAIFSIISVFYVKSLQELD